MGEFLQKVYRWYRKNSRDLPWRQTGDPYKIWISEIILQQTRVDQGMKYYTKFISRFPTIESLAGAHENDVLKIWQGLGYYSRARHIYSAARQVMTDYNGKLPGSYKELIKLKGIGDYTAAAIASIAFNLPYPAVDGNIYRLLSRYFGIETPVDSAKGKKEIYKTAKDLMPLNHPGFHNQALMEFGSLQCIPKSPSCSICPLVSTCYARKNKKTNVLPVKSKTSKQRIRYFYYYYIDSGEFTFMEQRTDAGIWQNLYQFPLLETNQEIPEEEILNGNQLPFFTWCSINIKHISPSRKHILSHQVIFARIIHAEIKNCTCLNGRFIQVNKKDIFTFAVPRLIELLMKDIELFQI